MYNQSIPGVDVPFDKFTGNPSSYFFSGLYNDNPAIDVSRSFAEFFVKTRRDTERHHFIIARLRSSRETSSKYLDLSDIRKLERNVPLALVKWSQYYSMVLRSVVHVR
ncbi:hypothetical protein E2986_12285 [Frieseomelitta varia]|uniref:Uncharacterized protein n=1 Tax=Frieseomelitta varia TaxID=561572 RepID=A0A833W574_9HYME|nr:hypothetical protein E2986_12285 [Frieseomelitta varia]